jgi:hypothetical protein
LQKITKNLLEIAKDVEKIFLEFSKRSPKERSPKVVCIGFDFDYNTA